MTDLARQPSHLALMGAQAQDRVQKILGADSCRGCAFNRWLSLPAHERCMQLLTSVSSHPRKWPMMPDVGVPLLVTVLLWYSSPYEVTLAEVGTAFCFAGCPGPLIATGIVGRERESRCSPSLRVCTGSPTLCRFSGPATKSSWFRDAGLFPKEQLRLRSISRLIGVVALWAGIEAG